MAGAPAGRGRPEGWRASHARRTSRFPGSIVRQVAASRRFRFRRSLAPHFRRQIQKERAPRAIRQLEMGSIIASDVLPSREREFALGRFSLNLAWLSAAGSRAPHFLRQNDRILQNNMRRIASRVSQLNGEGALAVYSRAKELERAGRSIIHLELGEPDFHPAAPVVDAACQALRAGRDRYVSTRGIPALREAIAEYLKRTRRLEVAPDEVLVAPGCKMALSLGMMALIEPGDEVLYPDPGFPIYPSFTRGLGAKAVPFGLQERNGFQPDLDEIKGRITPHTSAIIFNSPNNPTGTVFSETALRKIAELAAKYDLWVIADEIYARILFAGEYQSIW